MRKKIAIGYVRASKEEQTLTPDAQREAMRVWCERESVRLVAVFEDLGVCGATEVEKRRGLMSALSALNEHGAGFFLAAKRDRIGRDAFISAMVERLVTRAGAVVVSADGAGNGDGPEAQLMRRILDAFSEFERALIRTRTKAALAVKKSRGERTGGIPYGYQMESNGVHLEPCWDEQDTIRAAREFRAAGLSLRATGRALMARGILPRSGGHWHPKTVKAVVTAAVSEAA